MTERRLAAILSADVVGYSRLMAADEAETVRALKAQRGLVAGLVGQHAGRVVDAVGDELLAEFPSVVDAVACAVAVQDELAVRAETLPPDRRMLLRIGVNLGDVIVDDERIYGDGVNIAARIQALSEPGGVSVSGAAFELLEGKLGLEFEDLGPHELKNIPKPIRVYRVQASEKHQAAAALTVPGFSGRPAIAVLPFENLSADPEQEYFADGVAEDLITTLSRGPFPVIARNSSFTYKGQAVDVRRVSRELGVRYVVEGSVRRDGERIRITAQLIDATTGHHVWAERFDRDYREVFSLQDEVAQAIVSSLGSELLISLAEKSLRQPLGHLGSWECFLRGGWHLNQFTAEGNAAARSLFERARELDPSSAAPWIGLASVHYFDVAFQWSDAPEQSIRALVEAAERAVALDSRDGGTQLALAYAHSLTGRRDEMIAAFELAIELSPSTHNGYTRFGLFLALLGRPDEAVARLQRGRRLNPKDPNIWATLSYLALAHFVAERYEDAVGFARGSVQRRPEFGIGWGILAASLSEFGRADEARAAMQRMLKVQPAVLDSTLQRLLSTADPGVAQRILTAFRRAGLPD